MGAESLLPLDENHDFKGYQPRLDLRVNEEVWERAYMVMRIAEQVTELAELKAEKAQGNRTKLSPEEASVLLTTLYSYESRLSDESALRKLLHYFKFIPINERPSESTGSVPLPEMTVEDLAIEAYYENFSGKVDQPFKLECLARKKGGFRQKELIVRIDNEHVLCGDVGRKNGWMSRFAANNNHEVNQLDLEVLSEGLGATVLYRRLHISNLENEVVIVDITKPENTLLDSGTQVKQLAGEGVDDALKSPDIGAITTPFK